MIPLWLICLQTILAEESGKGVELFMNKMNKLLDKIERRLGAKAINLPDDIKKDTWAREVIENDTLDTFSRYFPHAINIVLTKRSPRKGLYFIIDEDICESAEIIGVKDIDWEDFSRFGQYYGMGYGLYDYTTATANFGVDDVALMQGRLDMQSMFANTLICEYEPPNLVKVVNTLGADIGRGIREIPVTLFLKHPNNLMTIPPTMMETFEQLAISDVAGYLYQYLKYFDGLETVYATIDLKMSEWENIASKREDIVNKLEESYVSAANKNQPLMFTTG